MTHRTMRPRLLLTACLFALALALPASASAELTMGNFECCSTSASSRTATTATLNALFNPLGKPSTVHFEYRLKGPGPCSAEYDGNHPADYSFGPEGSTPDQSLPASTEAVGFRADVTGLTAGALYCATFLASNADGTGYSQPNQFRAGTPDIGVRNAETTGEHSLKVFGSLNGASQQTDYHVDAWASCGGAALGASGNRTLAAGDGAFHPFDFDVTNSGLTRGDSPAFTAYASNASGASGHDGACFGHGDITVGAPFPVLGAATDVTAASATLNAEVNPGGGSTTYAVGLDVAGSEFCDNRFSNPAQRFSGTVDATDYARHPVSVGAAGLAPGTDYCFTIITRNDVSPGGQAYDQGGKFRTADAPNNANNPNTPNTPNNPSDGGGGGGGNTPLGTTGLTGGSNAGSVTADKNGTVTITKLVAECGAGPCDYGSTATTTQAAAKLTAAAKKQPLKVGSGKLTLQSGQKSAITIKLTSAGKRLLKKKKALTVSVKVTGKDAAGKTVNRTVKVKITAGKK